MAPAILLVDDQRDVLRLLHSVLDSLKRPELEIIEAPSGAEAAVEAGRQRIDLMVVAYRLPDMTGVELMHKMRAGQPDIKVILITGAADRKARAEMLNAGATAVFDKPIPLADFLDNVERNLGFARTIFPVEAEGEPEAGPSRFSDLLANFRQDTQASAVFLINDRGLVVARAGDLRDSSMEVSLVSALTAAFSAGLKVAKSNRQEELNQFSMFTGGDHDLILMPVDASYSLLLAGNDLTSQSKLWDTVQAMQAVRNELGRSLRTMGAIHDRTTTPPARTSEVGETAASPAKDMEALLKESRGKKVEQEELDAFWDQAAAQHGSKPISSDVIPYEEARKLGLTPDKE